MNIILLSGGSGKRLWPLSNDVRSKQFIKIFKTENGYESMLQRVYRQLQEVDSEAKITIATSKNQVSAIHNQIGENVNICVEPCRRDTFPAIALAASYLKDIEGLDENEAIVVCPVDSYVEKDFFESVKKLSELVESYTRKSADGSKCSSNKSADGSKCSTNKSADGSKCSTNKSADGSECSTNKSADCSKCSTNKSADGSECSTNKSADCSKCSSNMEDCVGKESQVALLGIEPLHPTEKYGYILPESEDPISKVIAYKEKPNKEAAEKYIAEGALWNGGVFAFTLGYALRKAHELIDFKDYDDLYNKYQSLKKISFDYAVLENEANTTVMRYAGDWKDMGSWNTLTEAMEESVIGKAIISDSCSNVHVLNDLNLPILCMGLNNVVITTSPEGILVTDKEESIHIKPYVEEMRQQTRFAEKSWGEFRVLDVEEESMTIKITLNPGHSMNYHSHLHRDEVWTVISGNGHTIVDGMEQPVGVGDVITMQAGCRHTVVAETELKLIEVQLGKHISVNDKQKYELED